MLRLKKNYKNLSDERLMELLQEGNSAGGEAFDALYDRYSRRLLFYFHRMLGGKTEQAQDFLQDLFLRIIERPNRFDPQQRFQTWIYTVAHNLCKNEYRRLEVSKVVNHRADMDVLPPAENESDQAEDELDRKQFQAALFQELERLDENHQTTFLLRHQNGFSIKEISEVLGCSEGTTKSRLFYAAKKLAAKLSAFHPNQSEVL